MSADKDTEELARWHRWFAVECNNAAWELAEKPDRSERENDEMLNAAHAAAFHWNKVGTEVHVARAEQLLAQVHALLNQGERAMHYAQRNLDFVSGRDSAAWELAFSHAVMAHAACKAGNSSLHAAQYEMARSLGESLEDPDEQEIFKTTFGTIPCP